MTLKISDAIIEEMKLTEEEIMLRLAISFFQDERFTLSKAAHFAGLNIIDFQMELAKRNITIHYGMQEFENDKEVVLKLI